MLQTRTTGQQIERDIQHMVGFAVRQMKPQDRAQPVDAARDIQLPHELLHRADPASRESLCPLRQLQLNRRRDQHRRLPVPVGFINPPGHSTLP